MIYRNGSVMSYAINHIAIFGGASAIAKAVSLRFQKMYPEATLDIFSRQVMQSDNENVTYHKLEDYDALHIERACVQVLSGRRFDIVLVATGILHQDGVQPEKSIEEVTSENMLRLYSANTIVPTLIVKHIWPLLKLNHASKVLILSARVGSISDNRLGGWYAYRCSKAALNMVIKNLALEAKRRCPKVLVCGYHPGTVDTPLSKPFQKRISQDKLFTPDYAAKRLVEVIGSLDIKDSGKCFAWDGQEVEP